MAQDAVDSAVFTATSGNTKRMKKVPSIEALNSEMPCKNVQKDRGRKMFKYLLNRLRLKKYASATISRPDPTYRVAYLGNVVTGWAKGEGCVEKPLATLWRNYTQSSRPDVRMQLTVSGGGLKATTKDHGLTEYWANRLTTCAAPAQFPRIFCWVYRHEGRRLRHELRCHAVLCPSGDVALQIEKELRESLALALAEFKKDKISRQNARLSLVNSVYENPTIPRRKILLSTGSQNYRPPLERSKSAPKLSSIEEIYEEEDVFQSSHQIFKNILKYYDRSTSLLERRNTYAVKDTENEVACKPEQVYHKQTKVKFNEDTENILTLDEKSDLILEELVQSSLRNDLLESCERAWYTALGEKPDLIPMEHDGGSLSSGCESSSTTTSESEPGMSCPQMYAEQPDKKAELDFKVGGSVLPRVCSFEKVHSVDLLKHSAYNSKTVLGHEEVSLVPVGESSSDFSSLKVYKKRSVSEGNKDLFVYSIVQNEEHTNNDDEEFRSSYSDESGYEEEINSSIGSIVLV
ncbi:uncharacterized protein LOC132697371 [Cylas formicarius]|uniref:uncharacterized protein LOC132697371 n=1 Tax=Cylas formicarius TaxID=197179 RepID=UPI0029583441|nr:uncharacterized protein LOC132697371 [Cylas formicarius]